LRPIEWLSGRVRLVDQARLPHVEAYLETADYRELAEAIRSLKVRGAPLLGITAAYGLALAAREPSGGSLEALLAQLRRAADELRATRPTAANLTWALDRVLRIAEGAPSVLAAVESVEAEALRIHEEDVAVCRRIGANGASLIESASSVLTHCNTGSLATGGYGTAFGVVRAAFDEGWLDHVYATETRPLLQGARLTAWELQREGIPHTLIVDSAAGSLMRRGRVEAVVVGADRIAANGDVANKIGTYSLAVLANENGVPFYVAAPTSTIDLDAREGEAITIEERAAAEVTSLAGTPIAPEGTPAVNPAFDVTPARYVSAIVTEAGIARAPYGETLAAQVRTEAASHG
jgi:methylthioribose-1-phosphate isomerase